MSYFNYSGRFHSSLRVSLPEIVFQMLYETNKYGSAVAGNRALQ